MRKEYVEILRDLYEELRKLIGWGARVEYATIVVLAFKDDYKKENDLALVELKLHIL